MFSAIPHEDLSIGRLPWVTWSLAAVWTAAALARLFGLDLQAAGLGVDPGSLTPQAFAAHWLFSETVVHWLGVTLLWLLLAPQLEVAWGARLLPAFFAGATLTSAGVYALLGEAGRPLVGVSGAVAAVMAALLVRHGTESVRTYVLAGPLPLARSFEAPVYAALGVWFVGEVLMTLIAPGSGPTRGLGTTVTLAGAAFGAAAAWAVHHWQLDERLGPERNPMHPALAAAQAAREAGRHSAAVGLLEPVVRQRPQDAELVRALCDAAVTAGEASRAAEPLRRFIAEQVRLGETQAAAGFWRAFGAQVPGLRLDARTALGLAEALAASGEKAQAARLLRDALAASPKLSPGIAMRFAEVAAPLHRETAIRAGKIALAAEGLDEAKKAKLAARVAALESKTQQDPDLELSEPAPAAEPKSTRSAARKLDRTLDVELDPLYAPTRPTELPPPAEPEAAFEMSADGSMVKGESPQDLAAALPDTEPIMLAPSDGDDAAPEFGAVGDLAAPEEPAAEDGEAAPAAAAAPPKSAAAAPPPHASEVAESVAADEARFHELKCVEAVPAALDETHLALRNGPHIDLARVDGIAVAAVQGLGAKPVILIDLLLNWTEISDAPLRAVRLRSDQFDPRAFFPNAGGGLDAFRALLDALVERTGATPLPDAASARGRPFKMFAELVRYEREVLQVER